MGKHLHYGTNLDRRRFLSGVTAAAAAGAAATVVGPATAWADDDDDDDDDDREGGRVFSNNPLPEPIPVTINTAAPGFDPDPPFLDIHWLLPGPPGATTQILELPAFGLDVDPSLITNFNGFTAYAVIAGTATGNDGTPFDCEFDVRVMQGRFQAGGRTFRGTYGFF